MSPATQEDLRDLTRALAVIRGQETVEAPEVLFADLVSRYTQLRLNGIAHARALSYLREAWLWTRYPGCPNPWKDLP